MKNSSVSFAASFIEGVQRNRGGSFPPCLAILKPSPYNELSLLYHCLETPTKFKYNTYTSYTHISIHTMYLLCSCYVHGHRQR